MQRLVQAWLLALAVSATGWQAPADSADTSWVEKSNAHAQLVLAGLAEFSPESAASIGVDGLDEEITDLRPELYERQLASSNRVLAELEKKIEGESDPRVRQDLGILIKVMKDNIRTSSLTRENMLPYINLSMNVFQGVRSLIDVQIPRERYPAAVVRIRRYAGLEDGYESLAQLAKDRTAERFEVDGLVEAFIREKTIHLSGQVTNTTKEKLRSLLVDASLEEWTVSQTSRNIESMFGDFSRVRSLTIARTEIVGANNGAAIEGYRQSEVVRQKEWLTQIDGLERDSHNAINGEVVALSARFSNGLKAPGVDGPAEEVINCRCAVLPVLGE